MLRRLAICPLLRCVLSIRSAGRPALRYHVSLYKKLENWCRSTTLLRVQSTFSKHLLPGSGMQHLPFYCRGCSRMSMKKNDLIVATDHL